MNIEETTVTPVKKKNKGFTLIELLIVIAILGILATVVVFSVSGIRDKGQESTCKADEKTMQIAVEAYAAKNGVYPPDEPSMVSDGLLQAQSANYDYARTGTGTAADPYKFTLTGLNKCQAAAPTTTSTP